MSELELTCIPSKRRYEEMDPILSAKAAGEESDLFSKLSFQAYSL